MKVETKTDIKHRMVKKAAELWGVSPNDIESSFDPIVSLLIGACASELAKISHEINGSQNRLTEKLVQLMTPESSNGAQPCNAIVHAAPTEPSTRITPIHQFYTQKRIKDKEGQVAFKSVFLSPIRSFKLVDTYVAAALSGDHLMQFEAQSKAIEKSNVQFSKGYTAAPSTLYIGVTASEERISLKGTSLFFELSDMSHTALFYNQLRQADFYFNGKKMEVSAGYYDSHADDANYIKKRLSATSKKMLSIEQQTATNYKQHYISFNSDHNLNAATETPDVMAAVNEEVRDALSGLHWIKVVFPSTLSNAVLKSVYTSFNTFPVLNRKLEHTTYQLSHFTHIVPFSTSDLFLDIRKISNDTGKTYTLLGEQNVGETKGAYALRTENVSKLDSRKAKDYLLHLIDLLKNESSAFSVFGSDFLQTNVGKLNQIISVIENKLEEANLMKANTHYVSINPYNKKESIFIDFWSTVGGDANSIRSNTPLQVYKGTELNSESCYLVTPTLQGRNTLSSKEQMLKYRHSVLSQERIVTREDVKALCFDICGEKIERVDVRKEFVVHEAFNKGKLPTLVIRIFKNAAVPTPTIEWDMLKNNIMLLLEERSTNVLPYKLLIN